MIEDINAQAHAVIDTLPFDRAAVALSALQTLGDLPHYISPFASLLGIEVVEAADGRAVLTLEVRHHLLNPLGIAHGGVPYALADTALGHAVLSLLGEAKIVTQDMHYRYHGPARAGQIRATAEIFHQARRTATAECQVFQADSLIGSATASFIILPADRQFSEGKNL